MDEKLKAALDFSNYMITLTNQKRIIFEKYQNDLLYFFNGGQFTVSQQLISFCQSLIQLNQTEVVIIDDNQIPVEIENLQDFTQKILNVYFSATNSYLSEYTLLKNKRSVESIAYK